MPDYLLKLDRALRHLEELEDGVERFLASDACGTVEEVDPDSGDYVVHVRLLRDPGPTLASVLGDCVHNMRSALDHIVFELASRHTQSLPDGVVRRSEFPIFSERLAFQESGRAKIKAIHPEAQGLIEAMQPYNGGDWSLLMLLHELDCVDKHRRLNLVVATTKSLNVTSARGAPFTFLPPGPIEDGDELFRTTSYAAEHMKPQGHATFEVAFGPGPGERSWVIFQLRAIHNLISERVVPPLSPYL